MQIITFLIYLSSILSETKSPTSFEQKKSVIVFRISVETDLESLQQVSDFFCHQLVCKLAPTSRMQTCSKPDFRQVMEFGHEACRLSIQLYVYY